MTPDARRRQLEHARDLFNTGEYWLAHEALETVWRSIIDEDERRVWQGLIQAAAALLHRERGNRHGVVVVGEDEGPTADARRPPPVEPNRLAYGSPARRHGRSRERRA